MNAETSVVPLTSATATAYGMENFAESMLTGAGSAMRVTNGNEVTRMRLTSSAARCATFEFQ